MPPPESLPRQLTSFIGRERELSEIRRLLSTSRLLTLTGAGGTGKTRLALQVASQLLDAYPDGVFFVNLAPIADQRLVMSTIAQSLGVSETAGQPLIEILKAHLQGKKMLLVLDNFEQVLGAATQLVDLLVSTAGLRVLVTSREPLHLQGEQQYLVPPMEVPNPAQTKPPGVGTLSQYEAVRLFVERAQSANPGFSLVEDNAHAVAQICARLDGLPLAIELAAVRMGVLTPQMMLSRLESRLKVLTGGARDLEARHQTLRNTIGWSYDLLEEGERQLFRRISVFNGGSTLEAMEAVCNFDGNLRVDVIDGMQSLVNKSLLQRRAGGNGEARYAMLETIHEYATEKLEESGERDKVRQRHASYFLWLAEEAEPHLWGGVEQVAWVRRLEVEYNNIRSVMDWACENQEVETVVRLGKALSRFWAVHGYVSEGGQTMEVALALPGPWTPSLRAQALGVAGWLAHYRDDVDRAIELLEESVRLYRALGGERKWYLAESLFHLAHATAQRGDADRAEAMYSESLALRRELGDQVRISQSLSNLGDHMAHYRRDYDHARELWTQALDLRRALGDNLGISFELYSLAELAWQQREHKEAEELSKEALALCHELGSKAGIVGCLEVLAVALASQGEVDKCDRAARLVGAVYKAREQFDMPPVWRAGVHPWEPTRPDKYERCLDDARAGLGEARWATAVAEGETMSLEDVIAYALLTTSAPSCPAEQKPEPSLPPSNSYPDGLTKREVQVLRQIAMGESNQQIARELVLSLRTVERHVSSIYQKIGAKGKVARASAATYALKHGLVT